MSLLQPKNYFNADYSWAVAAAISQDRMFWIPEEVTLTEDLQAFNNLPEKERNVIMNILRFFTQGDIDIARAYLDYYIPAFKDPSIQCMLTSFAHMESIHVRGYAYLLRSLNIPDSEFKAFLDYEAMRDKHEYLFKNTQEDLHSTEQLLLNLAVFSAFGEGMQLFSSFAVLLSFVNDRKLKNVGSILQWSVADESLHCASMIKLFHQLKDENYAFWTDELRGRIYQACRDMVELEFKFIDLVYESGDIPSLPINDLKQYIMYIADRRLLQLGLKPNYKVKDNPLEWLEWMLNAPTQTNFFEQRNTDYAKVTSDGWGDF